MKTRLKIALFFITCLQAGFSFGVETVIYSSKRIAQTSCQSESASTGSICSKGGYTYIDGVYHSIFRRSKGSSIIKFYAYLLGGGCMPDWKESSDGICSDSNQRPECPVSGTEAKKTITQSDFYRLFDGSKEESEPGSGMFNRIATNGPAPYEHCKIHFLYVNCFTPVGEDGEKGDRLCIITDGTYTGDDFVADPDNDNESPVPEFDEENTPENSENCGLINGEQVCIPKDETCINQALCDAAPQCKYVKGAYTCFDPNTQKEIPADSPDHPNNGGNADGDTSNDPISPDSPPPSDNPHSKDGSATNKKIDDLIGNNQTGFKSLGKKLDGISTDLNTFSEVDNSKLQAHRSTVNGTIDGVFNTITQKVSEAADDDLYDPDKAPDCEFSSSGSLVCSNQSGLMKKLDQMFPESESCQVVPLSFSVPGWSDIQFDMSMDFCPLTRAKAILFWFFNALTLFYLFYAFTSVSTGSAKKAYS